jgi:hypothetical protein
MFPPSGFLRNIESQAACSELVAVEDHSDEKAIDSGNPPDYVKTQPDLAVEARGPGDRKFDLRSVR